MLGLFGGGGYWVFAIPNVIGCAAFGYVLTRERSQAIDVLLWPESATCSCQSTRRGMQRSRCRRTFVARDSLFRLRGWSPCEPRKAAPQKIRQVSRAAGMVHVSSSKLPFWATNGPRRPVCAAWRTQPGRNFFIARLHSEWLRAPGRTQRRRPRRQSASSGSPWRPAWGQATQGSTTHTRTLWLCGSHVFQEF